MPEADSLKSTVGSESSLKQFVLSVHEHNGLLLVLLLLLGGTSWGGVSDGYGLAPVEVVGGPEPGLFHPGQLLHRLARPYAGPVGVLVVPIVVFLSTVG